MCIFSLGLHLDPPKSLLATENSLPRWPSICSTYTCPKMNPHLPPYATSFPWDLVLTIIIILFTQAQKLSTILNFSFVSFLIFCQIFLPNVHISCIFPKSLITIIVEVVPYLDTDNSLSELSLFI